MRDMVFDADILRLSDKFYDDYPQSSFKEILVKKDRPYSCLLIDSHEDYFICVPYRTDINHNYSYKFKKSTRSAAHKSGLDYTKIVIIQKEEYLDDLPALVDKDEYNETMVNLERIAKEAVEFVDDYKKHSSGEQVLHPSEYNRRYRFSPLQYFHTELNI